MLETIIGKDYPVVVIPLIAAAKKNIEIIVFDWRWYPQDTGCATQLFNQALIQAGRRGVKIRAIANSPEIVKVLNENGIETKKLESKHLVHSKLMLIDDRLIIIGSHNFTQAAFTLNYETSILVEDIITAMTYKKYFNTLFNNNVCS